VYNTPQSYTNYVTVSVSWGDENLYGAPLSPAQTSYAQGSQTFTFSHVYQQAGTYTVRFTVTNSQGQSNSSTVTVVVSGSNTGSLTLASLSPSSGRVGTQVVLTGSGFSAAGNTVRFGVGGTQHLPSFNNGTTIYYTVPQYVSPCDVTPAGQVCAQYFQQVTPGTYSISVQSGSQTTGSLNFTVTSP
jgi:PKD repeat protein